MLTWQIDRSARTAHAIRGAYTYLVRPARGQGHDGWVAVITGPSGTEIRWDMPCDAGPGLPYELRRHAQEACERHARCNS